MGSLEEIRQIAERERPEGGSLGERAAHIAEFLPYEAAAAIVGAVKPRAAELAARIKDDARWLGGAACRKVMESERFWRKNG